MKNILSIAITLLIFIPSVFANDWAIAKEGNGVKVYTRKATGSDIMEFKSITTVKADMKSLEAIMDNVVGYKNWQANIETIKILKLMNANEKYVYYTTDVPWPITSRDMVLNIKKTISTNGVVLYSVSCFPNYIEEKEDYIRMKDAKGYWQFTPQGNGKIEVIYQFYGDPRGSLPDWVINMFIVDGPYKALTNLKAKVEK